MASGDVVPVETEDPVVDPAPSDPAPAEEDAADAPISAKTREKKAKEPKEKKPRKPRVPPTHPPYAEVCAPSLFLYLCFSLSLVINELNLVKPYFKRK